MAGMFAIRESAVTQKKTDPAGNNIVYEKVQDNKQRTF